MKLFKNTGGGACFVDEALPRPTHDTRNAAAADVRLIVWCKDCPHQVEPDPAEMAERYGARTLALAIGASGALLSAQQPGGRYGGASEMRPQPPYCRRISCPGRPFIAHLSLLRQPRGDLWSPIPPKCHPVHSSDP